MQTFPDIYPCSTGHICSACSCQTALLFWQDPTVNVEPEVEDIPDLLTPLRITEQKNVALPTAPTRLAMGKYTWNDDFSARKYEPRGEALPLRNAEQYHRQETERSILTPRLAPVVYQKSSIAPPESVFEKRIVRKLVKSPRGTKEGKIVEENGHTEYYINGKRVSREQFEAQEWY